jgi:recombination protein RecT
MEVQNNSLTVFEKTKAIMRSDESIARFAEVLGSDRSARKYIGSVLLAVSQSDNLQKCTTKSIMVSAMRAATLKLTVDPSLGHSYLIPFKDTCTFVLGYKGLMQLALRSGKYRHINVATVYVGQQVIEDQLRGIHQIKGVPDYAKGKWVDQGYMLYIELKDGFSKTFYMDVEEITAHAKRYSKGYSREDSLWKTHFENMAKKTVVRLGLSRYGYFDADDYLAMNETISDDDDYNDADAFDEGELLESALEQQAEKKAELAGKTTDELNAMLGFEDEPGTSKKPAPAKKKVEVSIPKQSMKDYEIAASFKSKQAGKIYGDMSIEELQTEIMTLTQYEPKNQEEKVQVNDRISAAKQLIKYIESNPI